MFRRGTSLPARPSIPTKEEILEDLNNALPDDVIYEYSEENIKSDVKQPIKKYDEYENFDFKEDIPSESHLKIDSFLDKISCLKNNLITLKEQKTNLKNLEGNLIQEMNRIKKELNATSEQS